MFFNVNETLSRVKNATTALALRLSNILLKPPITSAGAFLGAIAWPMTGGFFTPG
jgi:hypothetical protein